MLVGRGSDEPWLSLGCKCLRGQSLGASSGLALLFLPKGERLEDQGCRVCEATLGNFHEVITTPKGVALLKVDSGATRFGVEFILDFHPG